MEGNAKTELARVLRVDASRYKRLVAVSDIHGNGHLLERLLGELDFSEEDALFLLGDFIERGRNSLATMRLVMRLCAAGNAFALQGNCDTLWDDLAAGLYRVDVNAYIDWRRDSLLADMCFELGLERNGIPPRELRAALDEAYADVFSWLRELPHIIDTEGATFVHAGLDEGPLDRQNAERCLRREAFLEEELRFPKPVICGHIPICNYFNMTGNRLSFQPLFLPEKNMLAIDGGNAVKKYGQLNALVLAGGNMSFICTDDLPEAAVCGAQEASAAPSSVAWNHREVEMLEEREQSALCRVKFTGMALEIPKSVLFREEGRLCSYDHTDYKLPVAPGERVRLLEKGGADSLVKRNGVIGWVNSRLLT